MRGRVGSRAAWFAFALFGCQQPSPPLDGGLDGAVDSGADAGDAGRDAALPVCDPSCPGAERCCAEPDGRAVCTNVVDDIHHCGLCGRDCVESGRGDGCGASQCTCGDFDLGCLGTVLSTCCVPLPTEGIPYCGNLARDPRNCGACFAACAPLAANRCEGGRCVCGNGRNPCAGTATDQCCPDLTETYGCVDTTRDPWNCGGCGVRCPAALLCIDGACTDPMRRDAGT